MKAFTETIDCAHCDNSWEHDFRDLTLNLVHRGDWKSYQSSKCDKCGHWSLIKFEVDIHVVVSNAEAEPDTEFTGSYQLEKPEE